MKVRPVISETLAPALTRMAYYELVVDQTVPSFLGAIRRAFEFLGGVPHRLKPDNLRATVRIDQLGQRFYQEDFFRFRRHYGHDSTSRRGRGISIFRRTSETGH
jgi:transposase